MLVCSNAVLCSLPPQFIVYHHCLLILRMADVTLPRSPHLYVTSENKNGFQSHRFSGVGVGGCVHKRLRLQAAAPVHHLLPLAQHKVLQVRKSEPVYGNKVHRHTVKKDEDCTCRWEILSPWLGCVDRYLQLNHQ
jgi:hypothetical protein